MKHLEVIKKIIEVLPDSNIMDLLDNDDLTNLVILCAVNKEYLTKENLKLLTKKRFNINYKYFGELPTGLYSNLSILITKYPELLNKLPNKILSMLNYHDKIFIIENMDTFPNFYNILYEIKSYDWIRILIEQPCLASKYNDLYKNIDWHIMCEIMLKNKEILKYVDLNKFKVDEYRLSKVMLVYPEIINRVNKDNISIKDWIKFFEDDPSLVNICPNIDEVNKFLKSNMNYLQSLVSKQPNFKYLLPSIEDLETNKYLHEPLVRLVEYQPQLIDELKIDIKKFDVTDWCLILSKQPQLIDKCDKINEISEFDWANIISDQPTLIKYCNKLNKLNYNEWKLILNKQPDLINFCRNISLGNKSIDLLSTHPKLIDKLNIDDINEPSFEVIVYNSKEYHIKAIKKYIKKFKDSELLTNMIGIYSDLKDVYTKNNLWQYVDFNKLSNNMEYSILK